MRPQTKRVSRRVFVGLLAVCAALTSVVVAGSGAGQPQQVVWRSALSAPGVVDLAGPRSDGRFLVAAGGRLFLLGRGSLTPFAQGAGGYSSSAGEPYIAMTSGARAHKAGCSFHRDEAFAIELSPARIIRITRRGQAASFASLPDPSAFLAGITVDRVGTFGHRILVTAVSAARTTLYAIDCRGRTQVISANGPRVEGGIEVAPRSFGRFRGQLIAVDELSGTIVAFKKNGSSGTVAVPSLPAGQDIGVENVGFVSPRLGRNGAALLADRGVPGAPHSGTDSILRLGSGDLARAGIRAGELLVATEGGAETVAVRCRRQCSVRQIGSGPSVAHAEGHIVFRRAR